MWNCIEMKQARHNREVSNDIHFHLFILKKLKRISKVKMYNNNSKNIIITIIIVSRSSALVIIIYVYINIKEDQYKIYTLNI